MTELPSGLPTARIEPDAGHEPAAASRQLRPQRPQFHVVARDVHRGAATMRKADHGDTVAPDVPPSNQQCRCHEHVGGAVAGGYRVARAHLALAARRKAVELEGRIALLLQKADPARQRAASHASVIARTAVQDDDDRERPRCRRLFEPARQLDLPALIIDRDRNLFSEFGRLFGNGAHHPKRGHEKDHDSEFAHCGSDLNRYAIGGSFGRPSPTRAQPLAFRINHRPRDRLNLQDSVICSGPLSTSLKDAPFESDSARIRFRGDWGPIYDVFPSHLLMTTRGVTSKLRCS